MSAIEKQETTTTQPIYPQEAFDWYDEYAHGLIDRRTFMTRLATLAGAGFTVSMLSSALLPNYALAEQVSFNDPDIKAEYVTFASPKGHGEGRGYLVTPTSLEGKAPVVLVIHENRGLNPYIKDVARRLAKAGFVAFAPDILHTLGGYPGNDDKGRSMQRSMDRAKIEQDFIAAALFLKSHELRQRQIGRRRLLLWRLYREHAGRDPTRQFECGRALLRHPCGQRDSQADQSPTAHSASRA